MKLSAPLYRLKREAKLLARSQDTPLHQALDAVARREGVSHWSLLSAQHKSNSPGARILQQLAPGDLLLLAARPGQGKTTLGLEFAVQAMQQARQAAFFTLEYTATQTFELLRELGEDPNEFADRFLFDCSDDICAAHIIEQLAGAEPATLVVVDYLQQLDLKRAHPPLEVQVRQLKRFAEQRGLVMVFISQVERAFELKTDKLPTLADVRLPNPLDLSLFTRTCFLGEGEIELSAVA